MAFDRWIAAILFQCVQCVALMQWQSAVHVLMQQLLLLS
jgi:hypothetical protein